MFGLFAYYKLRYERGQVFPYLIAIMAVALVMLLITANLGQLGNFKTETSNAADAAGLSAASVLSGTLIGLGQKSEAMCGRAFATLVSIVFAMAVNHFPFNVIAVILIYIVFLIEMLIEYHTTLDGTKMAWTSAKRSAVQYAFQNMSIEEPRHSFEEFLANVYSLDSTQVQNLPPAELQRYYRYYTGKEIDPAANNVTTKDLNGHTFWDRTKIWSQPGLSQFMANANGGFWKDSFGKIDSGSDSQAKVLTGYGWDSGPAVNNSYQNRKVPGDTYTNYANWVQVEVTGSTLYGLDLFSYFDYSSGPFAIKACVIGLVMAAIAIALLVAWWLSWILGSVMVWCMLLAVFWLFQPPGMAKYTFPMGFQFIGDGNDDNDTATQTTDNNILVRVTRHKQPNNLGLWTFRYGSTTSSATAHVFQEHHGKANYETIQPVFMSGMCFTGDSNGEERHLFESELRDAF